jgi:hypothetical protein
MSESQSAAGERQEVVLVTRPAAPGSTAPDPINTLREVLSNSVGMAAYTATTLASLVEQTVTYAVTSSVNAALDRIVPTVTDAVISRIDLTDVVLDQVDLQRIINSALDEMDLTQLVLDRVDVDAIVDKADIERVIDRIPIIDLADYVIDEIDLPQIIRDSTSGIAGDAVNTVRRQGIGADRLVSKLGDRLVLRSRARKVDAPRDPESLAAQAAAQQEATGPDDGREEAVQEATS